MSRIRLFFATLLLIGFSFSAEESSALKLTFLLDKGLERNEPAIRELSQGMSASDRYLIYNLKQKDPFVGFALNFLVGLGIGSFVQGDTKGGTIILVGDLASGALLGTGYLLMFPNFMASYATGFSGTPSPAFIGGAIVAAVGAVSYLGFYIFGIVRPFQWAKSYNSRLQQALGLQPVAFQVLPIIIPDAKDSRFGLALAGKF